MEQFYKILAYVILACLIGFGYVLYNFFNHDKNK